MFIYPYKKGSQGAKTLARAVGGKLIKTENSRFKGGAHKTVVNWGSSQLPAEVMKCRVLNDPSNLGDVTNKLKFFQKVEAHNNAIQEGVGDAGDMLVNIPAFATTPDGGRALAANGLVVERHKLQGHSGEGIVIVEDAAGITNCPLYVQYINKISEFRVHVIGGEVCLTQRKVKRADIDADEVNWKVRNHAGGFIFQQNGIEVPPQVHEQALSVMEVVGLDFGAVDVIFNQKKAEAYVLEVNTAAGLMGTTGDMYAEKLKALVG